jgi:Flp pilus assembly protein TadB
VENPEDKYKHLERIERQLQEKEAKLQLRKSEAEVHKTVKHQPEASGKLWQKKVLLGLKLFAFGIIAIVAVKVASFLAGLIIVGTLAFVAYKLFTSSKK